MKSPAPQNDQALVDILEQWRGEDSVYRGRPSFFLIKSLPELQIFWEKHAPEEPMPTVNFGNRMLFLWAPGPSLCGYRVMKAVRVVQKAKRYILELDVQRSDDAGAGQWRNPWLMVLLPKLRGDIEVVRTGDTSIGEAACMPLAMLWDMDGERIGVVTTAVSAVSAGKKAAAEWPGDEQLFTSGTTVKTDSGSGNVIAVKPAAIASSKAPKTADMSKPAGAAAVAADTKTPGNPGAPEKGFELAKPTEVMGSKDHAGKATDSKPAAVAAKEPAANNASDEADPFGDAFNLDF